MFLEVLPLLLSNYRQSDRPDRPACVTYCELKTVTVASLPPFLVGRSLGQTLQESLQELVAQGEVWPGAGDCYRMTPATVVYQAQAGEGRLLFRGDRAFLPLAHRVLATGQPETDLVLRSRLRGPRHLKSHLAKVNIGFYEVPPDPARLPAPRLPEVNRLRSPRPTPRLTAAAVPSVLGGLEWYCPNDEPGQTWRATPEEDTALLRVETGEYLWFEAGQLYDLDPEEASLALFALDRAAGCPLSLAWPAAEPLDLRHVLLPPSYTFWLWHNSQADRQSPRLRRVAAGDRSRVETALRQLGILLASNAPCSIAQRSFEKIA